MKKSILAPWLIRFYEWYHTYRRPRWYRDDHIPRRENLCHFGRVVFLWAPLRWFFHRRLRGGLRPWMFPAAVAYALFFAAAPVVTLAITVPLGLLFVWVGSNWIERTMTAGVGRVKVWHFLLVGAFAGISYLSAESLITVLIVLVVVSVLSIAIVAVIYAGAFVYNFLRRRIRIRIPSRFRLRTPDAIYWPVRHASDNVAGAVEIGWHWLVALKRKTICPWVSFSGGRVEFVFAPEPIKE